VVSFGAAIVTRLQQGIASFTDLGILVTIYKFAPRTMNDLRTISSEDQNAIFR